MKTMAMLSGGGTGSAHELAEMIRSLGRGRDTVLAHITPEEAELLRRIGGSGKPNPNTGLPEFQDEGFDYSYETPEEIDQLYQSSADFVPEYGTTPDYSAMFGGAIEPSAPAQPQAPGIDFMAEQARLPAEMRGLPAERPALGGMELPAPTEPTIGQRIEDVLRGAKETADKYPALTRLGVGGASALGQALLARRGRKEAEAMAGRQREAGAPFRTAAQEATARASAGGMTPQEQRAFEAAQARARQGLSERNIATGSAAAGIQAGQRARATSEARARAIAEGMRMAGIADQYEARALQLQLAQDKALRDILGDVLQRELTAATRENVPAPQQTTATR
jgi:hypothetical protein